MPGLINKFPGKCAYCGQPVAPYEGTLARVSGQFVPAHRLCAPPEGDPPPRITYGDRHVAR